MDTQVNLSITRAIDETMWAEVFPGQRASNAKFLRPRELGLYQAETHGHCGESSVSSVWKVMDRQPLPGAVGAT